MHGYLKISYFRSRYDQVCHAEMYPIPSTVCCGKRKKDTLFVGGWRPSLILVSLLKYATLGSHSGLRFDHRTGLGGSH